VPGSRPTPLIDGVPQTNQQLYRQLWVGGSTAEDLELIGRAYDLMAELASGRLRASGKPFLCHLVGTAGLVASVDGRPEIVIAALAHSAYVDGEWGDGRRGISDRKRARLRGAIGVDAEVLVAAYTGLRWDPVGELDALDVGADLDPTRRDLILMRLANEIDDHLDLAMCFGKDGRDPEKVAATVGLGRRLGWAELADKLAAEVTAADEPDAPRGPLYDRRATYLPPRSHRLRFWLQLRGLPRAVANRVGAGRAIQSVDARRSARSRSRAAGTLDGSGPRSSR